MKAFVTGAAGFIGSRLVDELFIRGDITDSKNPLKIPAGTDVVFHLAAALGASRLGREGFQQVNAGGTDNVITAARIAGVKRVIHFSSAGVLGAVNSGETADEHYPLTPKNIYDKTKLEGERIALRHAEDGMDVVVIRPGWVYGPGDRRTFKLIKAISTKRFVLVTKGEKWQTPVYIDDLIHAIFLCVEKGKPGGVYNVAGNEILTVRQITEIIAASAGTSIPRFSLPLLPVKAAAWSMEKAFRLIKKEAPLNPKPLNIKKAEQALGYSPCIDFKDGIRMALSWYKQKGWL
jgi:dihydroflavonol-4-reductase